MERILAAVAAAIISWLEARWDKRGIAIDSDARRSDLARGGRRVREWLRENGAGAGEQPGEDRP